MKRQEEAGKSELKGLKLTALDRKNMEQIFKIFKTCPFTFHMKDGTTKGWTGKQWLNYVLKEAHAEVENVPEQKSWKKSEFSTKKALSLPPPLMALLKESYPALLSDPYQFATFLRWFPELDLRK